uniref:MADF domain-containing protein n=1 Tax=Glossina palpalis gambiensis TaxID=67801 RepID=A0A1B0ANM7_9MUSC
METITLNATENPSRNPQLHVAAAAGLDTDHHHSPVDEEQMLNLSDITDLTQDDIVQVPKEMVLISLVSQEQALYNPKHENYRNTHRKDVKWLEIAECVGWTEMQCKAKWKAMRDQYCRELKRSKFNVKANVKWKYFKELDFLRPYALARNYRPRNPSNNPPSSNTSYNCSPTTNNNNNLTSNENNSTKFTTTIKIESNAQAFGSCEFVPTKTDDSTTLTEEQLNSVLQQQNQQTDDNNWSYLTGSTSSSNTATRLDNHSLNDNHMLQTHSQQQTDEALYNALVDCVGQIHQQQMCQQQPTINQQSPDEEDDDPIHTFLNIESYFEKELISLIHYEDVLYNSYNPNYRNVKLKLEVWDVIARKLKKSVKQCRLKWKALRDQFIREHKRLKNRENIESLPRWKHYDALSFLQKYIKHKTNDFGNKSLTQIPKTEIDPEMDVEDDHINMGEDNSPLRSPLATIKCELPQLQGHNSSSQQLQIGSLNAGPVQHQQHSNQSDNLCVSAGGYDDMDIDDYIIGDSSSVVDDSHHDKGNNGANLEQATHSEKHKFQSDFGLYGSHGNQRGTTATTATTTETSSKQQQQQSQQDLQPQQHINMPSLDLNDSSASSMIGVKPIKSHNSIASNNSNNNNTTTSFNGALSNHVASAITNGNNLTLNAATNICPTAQAITVNNQPNTTEAGTNTTPPSTLSPSILAMNQSTANNSNITNSGDDDEVGAFFKAVAMKIRNAKMSPVAFTDLQINILHVINDTLRNH